MYCIIKSSDSTDFSLSLSLSPHHPNSSSKLHPVFAQSSFKIIQIKQEFNDIQVLYTWYWLAKKYICFESFIYISSSSSCHAAGTDIPDSLSRHFSLSFIASGRSSRPHPVSSHSCWMYVRAGRPAFARPYVGVHRGTSLMSSSLLLQQWPACLVRLTWIVFVMGGRWPYSWCLVGCYRQDLFNIARNILA